MKWLNEKGRTEPMCGIAGGLFWNTQSGNLKDVLARVTRMTDALGHRGPDGRRSVVCTATDPSRSNVGVALGHTRLAIIDLTESAAQPMQSQTEPIWITFNGEIYNYESVRRELIGCGRQFRTHSDTEVILQGYEQWGDAVIDRLQGMFAFAIWDEVRARLLLARDRLGIKPIYVYRNHDVLLFASEIRSLFASGLVPRKLNVDSLDEYLGYQTVSVPRTLVRDVEFLPPGHLAVGDGRTKQFVVRQYWDLLDDADPSAAKADLRTARAHVATLLEQSVKLHLVSDVPVGAFLSGGIDSSAIVALARRVGATPRTFSVVMPGTRQDESVYARAIATKFATEHTEIELRETDFRDSLTSALASVDHPSGDGLNTFVVSQAVRKAGVKVALSGLGGDELFGGYPSFGRLRRLKRHQAIWRRSRAARALAAATLRRFGSGSVSSDKAAAVLESDGSVAEAVPIMRRMFSEADRRHLLASDGRARGRAATPDATVSVLADTRRRHPEAGVMGLVSYAESRGYMHDVLLRDTDQMSMAHGLEVRVPLLDHKLAEYVMGLPDDVKTSGSMPKPLLVTALGDALPDDLTMRPKQGFELPFDAWMKHDLRGFCEHHLGAQGLAGRGLFNESAVQSLWRAFLAGSRRTTWSRPWTLVALNSWLELNSINA